MTSLSVDVSLFADDTKCFSIVESLADARVLKTEAGNMEKWAQSERLKFNAQKCKVLSITRKRRPLVAEYIINGETLLHVSSQKDLGVTFSSDLSWNVHIQEQVTKANRILGMLKRSTTRVKNVNTQRCLYLTLVIGPIWRMPRKFGVRRQSLCAWSSNEFNPEQRNSYWLCPLTRTLHTKLDSPP